MKNLVFVLLAATFSSSSFADAMDPGGRSLPAANSTVAAPIANSFRPIAKTATGVFNLEGDLLHPASRVLSLHYPFGAVVHEHYSPSSGAVECGMRCDVRTSQ